MDAEAGQPSVGLGQTDELVAEANVRTQGEKLTPDGFHHVPQDVGADVGLVGPLDILWSAVGDENVEDMGDAGVVDPGGEFAVRKSSRAALAELDVGGGGELARLPEALYIGGAAVCVLPALQYDGAQARPGQGQRGEQARRAHPHHHRGQGGGTACGG